MLPQVRVASSHHCVLCWIRTLHTGFNWPELQTLGSPAKGVGLDLGWAQPPSRHFGKIDFNRSTKMLKCSVLQTSGWFHNLKAENTQVQRNHLKLPEPMHITGSVWAWAFHRSLARARAYNTTLSLSLCLNRCSKHTVAEGDFEFCTKSKFHLLPHCQIWTSFQNLKNCTK